MQNTISPLNKNGKSDWSLDGLYVTTQSQSLFEYLDRKSRSSQFWPFKMVSSCCLLSYNSLVSGSHVGNRSSIDMVQSDAAESDILIVAGTINIKLMPYLKDIYDSMMAKRWVLAFGSCANSGGSYRNENVSQGIGSEIPIDVIVPGCPPTSEALINGLEKLRERITADVSSAKKVSI